MTLASLATAISLVRYGWLEVLVGDVIDHAVRNIITLILSLYRAGLSLLYGFSRRAHFSHLELKKVSLACPCLFNTFSALAILRIEGVSGDLVPQFAFRWQAPT